MLPFILAAALPAAVVAHDHNAAAFWARQAAAASSNGASASVPTGAAANTVSVSLASVNPTAIPLSQITASVTGQPTTTYSSPSAGATPTYMSGPKLPDSMFRFSSDTINV
jgi:hypothetical protein